MRSSAPFALLAFLLLGGGEGARAQVDVTGSWEISWETPRGVTTSTFTFAQEGTALSGTALMAARGGPGRGGGGQPREVEISDGKVDGNTLTFRMAMGMGERSTTFTFAGEVSGNDIVGTMTTPRGETPFTGRRK
jgi:hypothetical protein